MMHGESNSTILGFIDGGKFVFMRDFFLMFVIAEFDAPGARMLFDRNLDVIVPRSVSPGP